MTLLFCDMSGSTAMGERLDAESVRDMMQLYFRTMRTIIERHGGTVEKFVGDAVMAVFGVPQSHEDDAVRAVRAAHEMQLRAGELSADLMARYGSGIGVRIGVNTGEGVVGDPATQHTFVTGDAVNVAARLEQRAKPGEILIGSLTERLARRHITSEAVEPLALKGKANRVAAFRLTSLRQIGAAPAEVRGMVGRTTELAFLVDEFRSVVQHGSCRLVTVAGEPGAGKSRLVQQFATHVAGTANVLWGRCLAYGQGITFWPLGEIVRAAASISADDARSDSLEKLRAVVAPGEAIAELVAAAVGIVEGQATSAEINWAVRRFFEALTRREGPVVAVVDDLQWAEPALLDLLESLAERVEAPLLLMCVSRPELSQSRPDWPISLSLGALDAQSVEDLVAELLPGDVSAEIRAKVLHAAGGNPLFIEELCASAIVADAGADKAEPRRDTDAWNVPTVDALIGARLDRLAESQRSVIERAAVEGEVFHQGAVVELSPVSQQAEVPAVLDELKQADLLLGADPSLPQEVALRFRHLLIRDVAYRQSSKKERADLHARFAAWLIDVAQDRIGEYEEIVGFHLEQSLQFRRELGIDGDRERALALAAAQRLASAGRRALARSDAAAAANLLGRARALMSDLDRGLPSLLLDLGMAHFAIGSLTQAGEEFNSAAEAAERLGNPSTRARALVESQYVLMAIDPTARPDDLISLGSDAVAVLTSEGDHRALARTKFLVSQMHSHWGHFSAAAEWLEAAVRHAQQAGDRAQEAELLPWTAMCIARGPTPSSVGIRRLEALRERAESTSGLRLAAGGAKAMLALLYARRGQFEQARTMYRGSLAILEEYGLALLAAANAEGRGEVELLAGNPVAAERELRRGFDQLQRMGETGYLSTVAARLAAALEAQGRDEEAAVFVQASQATAGADDLASQTLWRQAQAIILARTGNAGAGRQLATEAVALADQSDSPDTQADARMALAQVERTGGRKAEARASAKSALTLYLQKGSTGSAAAAEAFLGDIS